MKVYGYWKDGNNIYKDKKGYYIIHLNVNKKYLPKSWNPDDGNIFNTNKNKTKKVKRNVHFNLTKNQTRYFLVDKYEKRERRKICRTNKRKKKTKRKIKNITMKGGNVIGRLVHDVQTITKPLMNNPEPVIGGEQNPINPNPVKGHFISNEQSNNHNTLLAEQEFITKI